MGFERVFDNSAFKRMDAYRDQFHSVSRRLEPLFLDPCYGKQILTMVVRNKSP